MRSNDTTRRGVRLLALSTLAGAALATHDAAAEPGLADEVESAIVVAGATEFSLHAGQLLWHSLFENPKIHNMTGIGLQCTK